MIVASKKKVKNVGSCNFCNRGGLSKDKQSIIRPYRKVWVVSSDSLPGVEVRMCSQCLSILKENTK